MKIKVGAIIEVPTAKGLVYAQYTHNHERYGYLIRVIQGFYTQTPKDLESLANLPHTFRIFFPLGAAVRRKIFKIIGHASVPGSSILFPIFKQDVRNIESSVIAGWNLWDGENSWRVSTLTEVEKNYPLCAIWDDTLLIERIEQGWTDRGNESDYYCCDASKNSFIVRHECVLELTLEESIVIEWKSCCANNRMYSVWIEYRLDQSKRALGLVEENPLILLKNLLLKAIACKLSLPKSLKSTPGVMWNDWEDSAGCDYELSVDEQERNNFDLEHYLWISSRYYSGFNTWVYNDKNGAIIFEITPILQQLYYTDTNNKETLLPYEEWKRDYYEPYLYEISVHGARQLIDQIDDILENSRKL